MRDPFAASHDSRLLTDTAPSTVFASGDYSGYWIQGSHRADQDLWLAFRRGTVTGFGTDMVGRFVISGCYDEAGREVNFTKQYLGQHPVSYRGFRDGLVGVWGTWEIRGLGFQDRGGFHIWPKASKAGTLRDEGSRCSEGRSERGLSNDFR